MSMLLMFYMFVVTLFVLFFGCEHHTGVKSTSLPNSPLHAISNTDNGSTKVATKIDVAQTTRLKGELAEGGVS